MKFLDKIPRRKFLWMSRADVWAVRDNFITLFLSPEDVITVAPPKNTFGVNKVTITGSTSPRFDLIWHKKSYKIWLKLYKGRDPYWDVGNSFGLASFPFNHPIARIPALLIKAYSRHFPFIPTDNYFQKGGKFVA